jgi:hypothetical protein
MIKTKLLISTILFLGVATSFAQQKAVISESGKEVILYNDGTWKYVFEDESGVIKIDTVIQKKPVKSTLLVKGTKFNYGVWINPAKWSYSKTKESTTVPSEYSFSLKGEDAYGMIIPERIEIPLDELSNIAFLNAKNNAPDVEIVKKEVRKINGINVIFMQMEGTMKGIKFVYLAYYYSFENGSIQFVVYTSKSLLERYKSSMTELLNGLVILNNK